MAQNIFPLARRHFPFQTDRDVPQKNKVFVSFTTIPQRFEYLEKTIDSLLDQTIEPDHIFVHISKEYKRFPDISIEIPEYLKKDRKIVVNRCEDYGPACKLLCFAEMRGKEISPHCCPMEDEDILVVCDDDREYHKTFIEDLLAVQKEHMDCFITNAGWEIESLSEFSSPKKDFPRGKEFQTGGYIDVLGGCCGFCLPVGLIPKGRIFDFSRCPEARYVDDIWISGHLAAKGTKIWMSERGKDAKRTRNDNVEPLALVDKKRQERCDATIKHFAWGYNLWR